MWKIKASWVGIIHRALQKQIRRCGESRDHTEDLAQQSKHSDPMSPRVGTICQARFCSCSLRPLRSFNTTQWWKGWLGVRMLTSRTGQSSMSVFGVESPRQKGCVKPKSGVRL